MIGNMISVPQYSQWGSTKFKLGIAISTSLRESWRRRESFRQGCDRREQASEVDLHAFVHVGADVAEGRRFHDLELELEDAGRILVLVGPLEPDRHGDALEFLQILDRQPIELDARLFELAPRFHVGLLNRGMVDARIDLDLV